MVRPLSVYLVITASLLMLIGLFLPTGRGLAIVEAGNGSFTQIGQLQAEEMGCTTAISPSNNQARSVFVTTFESFFNTSGVLCGKSSLSMIFTWKYWWANLLLVIPVLLTAYVIFRLFIQPYARNHDRNLMLLSSVLGLAALLVWWGFWVKFRAYPGVGFWVTLFGIVLLFIAGYVTPQVDAFKERHHPHQA